MCEWQKAKLLTNSVGPAPCQIEERQLHQARLADGIERKREHVEKRWAACALMVAHCCANGSWLVVSSDAGTWCLARCALVHTYVACPV